MTTASSCLMRGSFATSGLSPRAICRPNEVIILKSASIMAGEGPSVVQLLLYSAVGPTYILLASKQLLLGETLAWEGWVVLQEGDYAQVYSDVAGVNYWLSGAVLIGEPAWHPITGPAQQGVPQLLLA